MAGDDFRVKFKTLLANWCLLRQPKPQNTWPAQDFGDFSATSRAQDARPVFGYVTAVEHDGKCKIRGRRSTFEGFQSLMAGDDFREKSQICRARSSPARGPEPHNTWPAQYFGDFEAGSSA